jgi:hypothetical protein
MLIVKQYVSFRWRGDFLSIKVEPTQYDMSYKKQKLLTFREYLASPMAF